VAKHSQTRNSHATHESSQKMETSATYIWVSADGLDGLVVKVTRVADHATDDVVCVLETIKDVGCDGELGALSQLHALALALGVDALDPLVVLLCVALLDVLLEDDHIRVGHLLGVGGGHDGSSALVHGARLHHGRCCGEGRQQRHGRVPHDGGCVSRTASRTDGKGERDKEE